MMSNPNTKWLLMALVVQGLWYSGQGYGESEPVVSPASIDKGRAIAFNRNAGNCLSCHFVIDAELPGNLGPPLIQMQARFPDRSVLRAQIWNAADQNPDTIMPPYGKHNILSESEVDLVVDYIRSL
jgi:sulfur-oxidizing protein SoxX